MLASTYFLVPLLLSPALSLAPGSMTVDSSFSDPVFDAFVVFEHHLDGHYPTSSIESSSSSAMDAPPPNHHTGDNVFLQELQGTHHSLLNPYGEIDWPVYEYHNPFASSLAPALDYDNTSSVGTVDEPFSPISDTTPVGPSMMPSDFKLPNPYDIDHAHINANRFNCSLNHDAAGPAFPLSDLPDMLDLPDTLDLPDMSDLHDTSGPYDHLSGYGHRLHSAYGAGTDAYSYAERSRAVNVSPGEVPLTFMYPGALIIADQEDPPAAPQLKKERSEASPTSSTPRRTTRGRQVPVNDVAEEDSGSDGKHAKGGKPEYRCQFCPSGELHFCVLFARRR